MQVSSWAIIVDIELNNSAPAMLGPSATYTSGTVKHCLPANQLTSYTQTPTGSATPVAFKKPDDN